MLFLNWQSGAITYLFDYKGRRFAHSSARNAKNIIPHAAKECITCVVLLGGIFMLWTVNLYRQALTFMR